MIGEDDLGLVDNVVEGRLPLPTEGRLASRPVPTLAVPPEGAAVRRRQLGDLALEPVVATWDFVTFRIVGRERTALVNVPRGQLGAFVASVDAGRLDGLLARYVANPNAARVLRTYAQTERVGGYTSVRPGPSMLPPDRPGVGPGTMVRGRPGKRLPPVPPPSADGGIRWWWWIVALVIAAAVAGALLLSGGGGGDEGERGEGVETQPTAPTTTEPSETTTTEPAVTTTEAAPQPPPTFFHAWQGEGTPELAWEDVAGLSVDEIRGLGDRLAVPGFSDSPLPNDGNTFPFPRRQFTLNPPDESTGGAYCASPYYTGGPGLDVFGNPVPESSELCSWGSPSVGDGVIYLSGDQLADWLDAFGG